MNRPTREKDETNPEKVHITQPVDGMKERFLDGYRLVKILKIFQKIKPEVVFILILFSLVIVGHRFTRELQWPYDLDQYREIAQTQVILDGHYGSDPYYLNEYTWYNPGVHFLLSGISLFFHIEVPKTVVLAGPFFNLLVIIAFYFMLRRLLGVPIALVSTIAYLFFNNGSYPIWVSSLYSPWIFPALFSQAFFFLVITYFHRVVNAKRVTFQYYIIGTLLGISFLFHSSPALMGSGVILFSLFFKTTSPGKEAKPLRTDLKNLATHIIQMALPAFLISLIFLYPIIWHYHLKVLNPLPGSWKWKPLLPGNLLNLIKDELFQVSTLLVIFGLILLVKKGKDSKDLSVKRILFSWLTLSLAGLAYSITKSTITGLNFLPSFFPAHHFFLYLKAFTYILFGIGVVSFGQFTWKWLAKQPLLTKKFPFLFSAIPSRRSFQWVTVCLVTLLTSLYIFTIYPGYKHFSQSQVVSQARYTEINLVNAYHWIRKKTQYQDVFLCSNYFSMKVVGPAGRKVIATHPCFSNTFVDLDKRNTARDKLFTALKNGNAIDFKRLCTEYHVKFIIANDSFFKKDIHPSLYHNIKGVFRNGYTIIARVENDSH